jgi:hypothetical protein
MECGAEGEGLKVLLLFKFSVGIRTDLDVHFDIAVVVVAHLCRDKLSVPTVVRIRNGDYWNIV